jgi:ubiquinone/menaquinone biosynthesis C-methylase UbiE
MLQYLIMIEGSKNTFKNPFAWYRNRPEGQYSGDNARLYDRLARLLTARVDFARHIADIVADEHPSLTAGDKGAPRILELFAGTGLISGVLDDKFQAAKIDLSLDALKLNPGEDRICSDALELPFRNNSFGLFIIVGGYRYLRTKKDESAFWDEINRVGIEGSSVYVGEFHPKFNNIEGPTIDSCDDGSVSSITSYPDFIVRRFGIKLGYYAIRKISIEGSPISAEQPTVN